MVAVIRRAGAVVAGRVTGRVAVMEVSSGGDVGEVVEEVSEG